MKTLCLIASTNFSNPPPAQLQELFKNRTAHQLQTQNPWLEVKLDSNSCDENGTYGFADNALELRLPKSVAPEIPTIQVPFEDLFEGYKLNLAPLSPPPPSLEKTTPSWVWWGLGIAAGVGIVYWATQDGNNPPVEQPSPTETSTPIPSSPTTTTAPTTSRKSHRRLGGALFIW